ncbi:hypothetical protein AB0A74_09745 [Saccharothrix sp. NPDC042600]|uniref:hypothetical protein n=1 Tax=Saccharothrix TaxID=2071 RepID=UPI003401F5A0|nr:hypothetical protein GCM10017745_35890 [Saccharothrix mutabilis subsp. capreolus]
MAPEDDAQFDAGQLIDQIFELWVLPYIQAAGLDLTRADVWRAVVVMPSSGQVGVLLNDEAELVAKARVNAAVAVGEPVTVDSADDIESFRCFSCLL